MTSLRQFLRGAVPAKSPELVIVVVLDEPESSIYGGSTAAPIFRDIASAALPVLGVAPTIDYLIEPQDWKVMQASVGENVMASGVRSIYGLSLREVRRFAMANDVQLHVHGNGWVTRSDPSVMQGLQAGDSLEVWLNE